MYRPATPTPVMVMVPPPAVGMGGLSPPPCGNVGGLLYVCVYM